MFINSSNSYWKPISECAFCGMKTIFWHNCGNQMVLPSPKVGDIAGPRRFEIGERNLEAFGRTGL